MSLSDLVDAANRDFAEHPLTECNLCGDIRALIGMIRGDEDRGMTLSEFFECHGELLDEIEALVGRYEEKIK